MSTVTESMTVNEVLRRWPATGDVFNRYGLDLCCGGSLTLAQGAAASGVNLSDLIRDLEAVVKAGAAQ